MTDAMDGEKRGDGIDCKCHAYGEHECGCGADWTPQEVYDLRKVNKELRTRNAELEKELRDWIDACYSDQKDWKRGKQELKDHIYLYEAMKKDNEDVIRENSELRTRVAVLETEAKLGNIPYKEAVELKKRVAELEQRMIDQANMLCKKANEADMERKTAEMHCADAVKLSKRVEELEKEIDTLKLMALTPVLDGRQVFPHKIAELESKLSTLEKENTTLHDMLDKLEAKHLFLLKASEGLEKALVTIECHGNANSLDRGIAAQALADFRAVKEGV